MSKIVKRIYKRGRQGFTLPVVVVTSIAILIVGMSLMQNSSSIYDSLNDQYYGRLADEAAEAGVAYANFCLSDNGFLQTWGPAKSKPNLTQKTNCTGSSISSAPGYIVQNGQLRTSFSVGDLSTRSDGAIILSVTGKLERIAAGSVQRTYTVSRNEVVKWKEFNPTISSSGTAKTCAVVTNELYCWGKNSNSSENFTGNLGDGTSTDSLVPVKVAQQTGALEGKVVTKVTSAQYHSCALAQGTVYCWGINSNGQLGNSTTTNSSVPVAVGGALASLTVTDIATTGNTSCAIANSKIYCWGNNSKGTMGDGTTSQSSTPKLVSTTNLGSSYVATKLATSGSRSYNMCAIADNKAWCWGNNEAGQVGNNTSGSTNVLAPTKVYDSGALSGKTVTSISQDGYFNGSSGAYPHVCVVASGAAYCWGENNAGQLGRAVGNTTDSSVPVAVSTTGVLSGKTITDIVVGLQHSCALTSEQKTYCWGYNGSGQLGNGNNTTQRVPVAISMTGDLSGQNIVSIGGGANRGCVMTDGYQSFCWGLNDLGQLGDGTQTSSNVPVEALFLRPKAPTYMF